jgi:hypothetical protein
LIAFRFALNKNAINSNDTIPTIPLIKEVTENPSDGDIEAVSLACAITSVGMKQQSKRTRMVVIFFKRRA